MNIWFSTIPRIIIQRLDNSAIIHSANGIFPERWTSLFLSNLVVLGLVILGSVFTMKLFLECDEKLQMLIFGSSNKRLTEFKIIGWSIYIILMGIEFFLNIRSIHLLLSHEEYYPEYFLPDPVISLIVKLLMIVIHVCEYPVIYSRVHKCLSTDHQRLQPSKWKEVIRSHAIAIGWAGPLYFLQYAIVNVVNIVILFFNSPLITLLNIMYYGLLLAITVTILHELYLMLRHPRNCCICKNHVTILICLALYFITFGVTFYIYPILSYYNEHSPLLTGNKVTQYVISSVCVALLGYFGRKVAKGTIKGMESQKNNVKEDVQMLSF